MGFAAMSPCRLSDAVAPSSSEVQCFRSEAVESLDLDLKMSEKDLGHSWFPKPAASRSRFAVNTGLRHAIESSCCQQHPAVAFAGETQLHRSSRSRCGWESIAQKRHTSGFGSALWSHRFGASPLLHPKWSAVAKHTRLFQLVFLLQSANQLPTIFSFESRLGMHMSSHFDGKLTNFLDMQKEWLLDAFCFLKTSSFRIH